MITMSQKIVPGSRTQSRGSAWVAEAMVDVVEYSIRSRSGAPMALARSLVDAGIADQPVRVTTDGLPGHADYPSLVKMAGQTIGESAAVPVSVRRWVEYGGIGGKTGVEAPECATGTPPTLHAHKTPLRTAPTSIYTAG